MKGKQLDLFSVVVKEKEDWPLEGDAVVPGLEPGFDLAKAPFDTSRCVSSIGQFDTELWLRGIIENKEYMVFLHGENPNVCLVGCHSSWERHVKSLIRKAWIDRKAAVKMLVKEYFHHSHYKYRNGTGEDYAEVYVRRG